MTLILSVASYRNRPPAAPLVVQFEGQSVAIGRGADNDWSLPDPEVHLSKKHCVIYCVDGQYSITDISTNGVFVNGSAEPLGNGGTAMLRTGDRLLMGDYEIAVEIRVNARSGAGGPPFGSVERSPADPFGLADIVDPAPVRPSPFARTPGDFGPPPQQDQSAGVLGSDWLREFDPVPRPQQEPDPPQFGAHSDHVPSVDAAYRPPNVSFDPPPIGTFDIPDNWQNAPDAVQPKPLTPPPADWQVPPVSNAPPPDWQGAPPSPNSPPPLDWQVAPAMPAAPLPRQQNGWQTVPVMPNANPAVPPLQERGRSQVGLARDTSGPFRDGQPVRETSPLPRNGYAPPREPAVPRTPDPPQREVPPAPSRREAHPPPPVRESFLRPRDGAPPPPRRETPAPPRDIPSPLAGALRQRREGPALPEQPPPVREVPTAARQQAPVLPPAASPPGRGHATDAGWRAFLDGAGLEESAFAEDPVDLMRSLGRVFREMVGGLRDLLAIRDKVKTEYRVQRTVIQASNNNPLKFAIDGMEAANLLLSRPKPGHLAGPKAVNEAFNDLKAHELAFMVGMQAAVAALLQEFDPVSLRKRIDAEMGWDSIIPGARQSKYWSGYEEHYRKIASEISENARSTFGLAFAKAYEEQSKKL
jgi:type VI secretion system FHA domain protein